MKTFATCLVLFFAVCSCQSQDKKTATKALVGGPCEGCEAIFEYGNQRLSAVDTLPDFAQNEPKLKLTGTVFNKDGRAPAKDVILYIYQTDRNGLYPKKGDEKGWARRHGYIRGWIKTDRSGRYTFYTFRPASYPDRIAPEHIHITVKEPGYNEYYIDDFVFDDDPLLTKKDRKALLNRGGSGISVPVLKDGILTVNRDIILGLNIPNYE